MAKKKTTSGIILTARQLLNGYTTDVDRKFLWNTAPYQMIPIEEKDDEWRQWNMDWLEHIGLRQLMLESTKVGRNYDMANGVIDRRDYLITRDNEHSDMVGIIANEESNNPFSLKFYPIIPNVINVLLGEFSKRDKKMIVKAVDEFSQNEALDSKMQDILSALVQDAEQKQQQFLKDQGIDENSDQGKQAMQSAAELAQAEVKFKTFRGIAEEWGQHIINSSYQKFGMYEKEAEGFRDSLVTDREFWHIDLLCEEDFNVELWNPIYTFYHKSPDVKYIADGNYVGNIRLISVPDAIDGFGHLMNDDQIEQLKQAQSLAMQIGNVVDDARRHDTTQFWDASQPYDKQQPNSVHYEQYMGMRNLYDGFYNFDWNKLRNLSGNIYSYQALVRVTKAYWKSQRKVGHLTRIMEDGTLLQEIVDEKYKVTIKPVYDKSIVQKESADNLVYGEHIDWIWINEVWGGIKIGPNSTTYYQSRGFGFQPIYLKIEPIPFQFKGRNSLYGSKLPVEGRVFTDRNTTSSALVDKMKSGQIGFNVVNNKVMDLLADDIGKVLLIDQNMIPRNSLEGSWGKYNFPKFYQVMKDFQIAAVDSSIQNTENPGTAFSHFQQVDLSKTEQIIGYLKLADYFKNQAMEVIGITPQRLGEIQASESATGTQQAVNNSYSQTEMYFEQHVNYLMPRVYQMILEAAQYVTAEQIRKKGYANITYFSSKEQKEWFRMEEDKVLLREYDIYAMSKSSTRQLIEKLQQLAIQNNTAGGSLYELAQIITMDSVAEMISKLKEADDNRQQQAQAQQDHELQLQKEQQIFQSQEQQKAIDNQNYWEQKKLETQIYVAELQASKGSTTDINPLDVSEMEANRTAALQEQAIKQRELDEKTRENQDKVDIAKQKIQAEKYKADMALKVAKENAKHKAKPKK